MRVNPHDNDVRPNKMCGRKPVSIFTLLPLYIRGLLRRVVQYRRVVRCPNTVF